VHHNHKTHHETINVQGLDIFYRHAGDPENPAIVLLHGYPTSSYMYRNVIEPLAECAYVVAPDLPGFGYSSAPSADAYDYTFEKIANTIDAFLAALNLDRYFLYIHDFGTPVGYHLATRRPERIRGLIVQNGNAHDEGLGPDWDAPKAFFADPHRSEQSQAARLDEFRDNPISVRWSAAGASDAFVSSRGLASRLGAPVTAWYHRYPV
jgi:pimeloyl-ACP methyl ester carboxylesterase